MIWSDFLCNMELDCLFTKDLFCNHQVLLQDIKETGVILTTALLEFGENVSCSKCLMFMMGVSSEESGNIYLKKCHSRQLWHLFLLLEICCYLGTQE